MCRCAPKGLTLLSAPALSPLADSKSRSILLFIFDSFLFTAQFLPYTHTHTYIHTHNLAAGPTHQSTPSTHTHTPSLFFYSLSCPRWLYSLLFSAGNSNTQSPCCLPCCRSASRGEILNAGSITPALFFYIYIHTITCRGEEEYNYICWESKSIDTRS